MTWNAGWRSQRFRCQVVVNVADFDVLVPGAETVVTDGMCQRDFEGSLV